jgi:hypothetical protein
MCTIGEIATKHGLGSEDTNLLRRMNLNVLTRALAESLAESDVEYQKGIDKDTDEMNALLSSAPPPVLEAWGDYLRQRIASSVEVKREA